MVDSMELNQNVSVMVIKGYHGMAKEPIHGSLHLHTGPVHWSVVVVEVCKLGRNAVNRDDL